MLITGAGCSGRVHAVIQLEQGDDWEGEEKRVSHYTRECLTKTSSSTKNTAAPTIAALEVNANENCGWTWT